MRIKILVDRRASRRWQSRLRDRLARVAPQADVALVAADGEQSFPSALDSLLALERMLLRRARAALCDSEAVAFHGELGDADVVVDLTGVAARAIAPGARLLRPLYDGDAHETAAAAALVAGACPHLSLQEATGAVVATGLPSLEIADGLTGGLEAVWTRVITLVEQAVLSPRRVHEPSPESARGVSTKAIASYYLKGLARHVARKVYHLCCHAPHWRVGWRYCDGPGVMERGALDGPVFRAMPDLGTSFSADPFPIFWRGAHHVFFERLDHREGRGEIWTQAFDANGPVGAPRLAISEPWHLSYPFLIEHGGELYMLPEASLSGAVTLYRCVDFPTRWVPEKRLLEGVEAADATVFPHDGRYWMTSVVRDGAGGYSDTLAIHHASDLFGPWEEHAQRPMLVDSRLARPAGAVARRGGALYRPVQDCSQGYGRRLRIARIDALDAERFEQTPVATLAPGPLWPGSRLHTINRSGRLECVDGAIFSPKPMALRRLAHAAIDGPRLLLGEGSPTGAEAAAAH